MRALHSFRVQWHSNEGNISGGLGRRKKTAYERLSLDQKVRNGAATPCLRTDLGGYGSRGRVAVLHYNVYNKIVSNRRFGKTHQTLVREMKGW